MKAKVISAFPGCGKTTATKKYGDVYSILDSDSSEFSWLKDSEGNNTKRRNPEFPGNYMQHIKNNIDKVDIIFVSSHDVVRKALEDNEIDYTLVYPKRKIKDQWIQRLIDRGDSPMFVSFIFEQWDKFIIQMEKEEWPAHARMPFLGESYIGARFIHNIVGLKNV